MLRRIRVGQRLITGFTLLILAVVAAAGVGISKMSAMHGRAVFIAENPLVAIDVLGDLQETVAHYRIQRHEAVEAPTAGERAEHLKNTLAERAETAKALKEYEPTIVGDADQAGFDTINAALTEYTRTTAPPAGLVESGREETAAELLNDAIPAFDALDAAVVDHLAVNGTRPIRPSPTRSPRSRPRRCCCSCSSASRSTPASGRRCSSPGPPPARSRSSGSASPRWATVT